MGETDMERPMGRTVFRDPSVTEGGPASLLADAQDLLRRLEGMGRCLIWTMLGEKMILGGSVDDSFPRRIFSQVALMHADGSVTASDRVYKYGKHLTPGLAEVRSTLRP